MGTGNPDLEGWAKYLSEQHPDRIASFIKYDGDVARILYASGDIFLMPSLYEPCGLSQMFSMRYGNLPVATSTGGLADSIVDFSTDPEHATGFLYHEKSTQGLVGALRLALDTYKNKTQWQKMQENAMKTNFSWATSAGKYYQVYQDLTN